MLAMQRCGVEVDRLTEGRTTPQIYGVKVARSTRTVQENYHLATRKTAGALYLRAVHEAFNPASTHP
jgi:hypothetical protein